MKVKPTNLRFSSLLITLLFALLVRVSLLHATNVPLPAAPIMPFDSTEDGHVEDQMALSVPMRNADASHDETKQEQHDENSLSQAYAIKNSSSLTITTSLYLPLILKNSSVTSIITATTTPTTSSTVTSTPITEIGDVNCNGDLDTIDGMFILQYSVLLMNGINTCPPPDNTLYEPHCDVNGDQECNVFDGLIVLQCDVNLWNDHLCPSLTPTSALRSASRSKQTLSEGASATVAIGSYEMLPMSALTVPVTASVPSDILFGAGEVRMTYDESMVSVESCIVNPDFIGVCNTNLTGTLEFNAISLSGATGAFTLAEITFQAIDQASNSTILDVDVEAFGDTAANPISVSDVDGEITIISMATPTNTDTPTPSPTATNGDTPTPTPSPTATNTDTPTPSPTPTNTPTPWEADVFIYQTDVPDPVNLGEPLTYTITVGNNGPASATNVTLLDSLSDEVNFVSVTASQGSCSSPSDNEFTCNLENLAYAESVTVTLIVEPQERGVSTNTANVSNGVPDPNLGNNSTGVDTIVEGAPVVNSIFPNDGLNDIATQVYIRGFGFEDSEQLTVSLSNDIFLDDVTYLNDGLLRAIVPAELESGSYDITLDAPSFGSGSLSDGYEVLDANHGHDLRSSSEWLETEPLSLQVGSTGSIGLQVQRLGGQTILDGVFVEFRFNGCQGGYILGFTQTSSLAPSTIESTTRLFWEPQAAGEYTICVIIDPDNEVVETNETNNVISRTLTVLPFVEDTVPPVVNELLIEDGAESTNQITVTLAVNATDPPSPGASEVLAVQFIEFEYLFGAHRWVPVQNSGWQSYPISQDQYPWTLSSSYGTRYIQAWAVDQAGNISVSPKGDSINLVPSEQSGYVAQDGMVFYRMYLEAGQTFSATLTPENGDPDLYVWGANKDLWYSNQDTGVDSVIFEAPNRGTYQIEVHGYTDADYGLSFGTSTLAAKRNLSLPTASKELPLASAVPLDDLPVFYDLDPPPLSPPLYRLYIPFIR